MATLWTLGVSFLIIGMGAYGGGMVTVPLMQHELVETHHFLTVNAMSKIVAIAQMTPGPIAVNGATFVGFRTAGITGALLATLLVVLPGLLILTVICHLRNCMQPNPRLLRLRRGLRAGVLSLLLYAVWRYGCGVIEGPLDMGLAMGALLALVLFEGKMHPLMVILGAGALGMVLF